MITFKYEEVFTYIRRSSQDTMHSKCYGAIELKLVRLYSVHHGYRLD